jgi:hypothetical protein
MTNRISVNSSKGIPPRKSQVRAKMNGQEPFSVNYSLETRKIQIANLKLKKLLAKMLYFMGFRKITKKRVLNLKVIPTIAT